MTPELLTSGNNLVGQIAAAERHVETIRKGYQSGKKLSVGADALNESFMPVTMDNFIASYLSKAQTAINRLKADFAAL